MSATNRCASVELTIGRGSWAHITSNRGMNRAMWDVLKVWMEVSVFGIGINLCDLFGTAAWSKHVPGVVVCSIVEISSETMRCVIGLQV